MKAFEAFYGDKSTQNEDHQQPIKNQQFTPFVERKRPNFSEKPKTMQIEPIKPNLYDHQVGFSSIGLMENEQQERMQMSQKYGAGKVRSKGERTQQSRKEYSEGSDNRSDGGQGDKNKYMDWMKNLSMFHQLKEQTSSGRRAEGQEEFKLQVLKSVMEKNRVLEEMERKVGRLEEGEDPVQEELLKKIEQLEAMVNQKSVQRKEARLVSQKMDQMVDMMMYQMGNMQQMMTGVAQMQKLQYQQALETNKVLNSLPQLLAHSNYTRLPEIAKNKLSESRSHITVPTAGDKANQGRKQPLRAVHNPTVSNKRSTKDLRGDNRKRPLSSSSSDYSSNSPNKDRGPTSGRKATKPPTKDSGPLKVIDSRNNLISSAKNPKVVDSNNFRSKQLSRMNIASPQGGGVSNTQGNEDKEGRSDQDSSEFNYTNKDGQSIDFGQAGLKDKTEIMSERGMGGDGNDRSRKHKDLSKTKSLLNDDSKDRVALQGDQPLLDGLNRRKSKYPAHGVQDRVVTNQNSPVGDLRPVLNQPNSKPVSWNGKA